MRQPKPRKAATETWTVSSSRGHLLRTAISLFLAFNLFAILSWCVPLESPFISACRNATRRYMLFTGLFQKWDMFAPNPSSLNGYVGAQVIFHDGHTALWSFPRMEELGLVDKYFRERYRKYAVDNLRLDTNSVTWPDAARYIARLNNSAINPPVAVNLIRYWSTVPPPTPDGSYDPPPWQQFAFFHYDLVPGDLP